MAISLAAMHAPFRIEPGLKETAYFRLKWKSSTTSITRLIKAKFT